MQNTKSSYVKALLTSGMFCVGIILGVILSAIYVICDAYGYVEMFATKSSQYVAPIFVVLGLSFVAFVAAGFMKAKSKTLCLTEMVIGLLAVLFALMIYVLVASANAVVFAIIAMIVIVALIVFAIVIRNKNFDSHVTSESKVSNATFKTYYQKFFKTYGVVSVIFAVLAIVAAILLEKANIVGHILSGNSLKAIVIAGLAMLVILFGVLYLARIKSKEIGIVDVALFMLVGGVIGLIPVAFMVGEMFRVVAIVILLVALVATVVLTCFAIKNTHIYTAEEDEELDKGTNGIASYFKALAKKVDFFTVIGIATVITAVAIFAEGVKLPALLIKVLNTDATIILVVAFAVMAFAAAFVLADIKDHRITEVDPALLVWNVSFILLFVTDFAILHGAIGLKFWLMVVAIILGVALNVVRAVFVRFKEEVVEEVKPVVTTTEETTTTVVDDTTTTEEETTTTVVDDTTTTEEETTTTVLDDTTTTEEETTTTVVDDTTTTATDGETDIVVSEDEPIKLKRVNSKKNFEIYLRTGDDQLKENYSAIKNAFYYYGVHSRVTKSRENFSKKGISMSRANPEKNLHLQAKLLVRGKFLKLYINIDPTKIDPKYFRHSNASSKSPDQPTLVKIRSKLSLKRALELIDMLANQEGYTKKKKFEPVDYKANLTDENLTYMQKLGFDYMIKDSVTLDEVMAYNDEFAKKIIKTQVIEKAERYIYDEITLDTICANFADGEIADLEAMRVKGLVKINANCVTVKPSASLNKKLIVVANVIDPKAAEMIAIAGGECTQLIEG